MADPRRILSNASWLAKQRYPNGANASQLAELIREAAQRIEAAAGGETGTGSTVGESRVSEGNAPNSSEENPTHAR